VVGRGSGNAPDLSRDDRLLLRENVLTPDNPPSRVHGRNHGSDFASAVIPEFKRAQSYVGQVGAFFDVTERVS
jgi:hypothetical protein